MGRLTRSTTATITLVGALALALTGCTSGTGTGGTTPSVPVGGDTGASPTTPPLGIYGLESAVVTGTVDALMIDAPGDCAGLLSTLETGQWSVNAFVTPTGALNFYLVELHRDGRSGILRMSGSDTTCHGVLSLSHEENVSLSGDVVADGSAQFLPYSCQYQDDEKTTVAITALYDFEDDLHVSVDAEFDTGTGELDPESIQVATLHGPEPLIVTMGRMLKMSFAGDEEGFEAGLSAGYYPGDDIDGEATISSSDPLTGTITLSGLANEETGANLSLVAGFRCTP